MATTRLGKLTAVSLVAASTLSGCLGASQLNCCGLWVLVYARPLWWGTTFCFGFPQFLDFPIVVQKRAAALFKEVAC